MKRPDRPKPEPPKRERSIENYFLRKCTANGWECWKLNVLNRKGVPDRMILADNGLIVFCEIKKPKGGKITPLQVRTMEKLRAKRIPGFFIQTIDDADHIINWISNEIRAKAIPATSD